MPLANTNLPDLSLLREFHFSSAIQQTYKRMMGEVMPPTYWEARFSVNVDPLRRQRILRLTIQVKDHQRIIHLIGGESPMEEVPGRIASAEEPIEDYLIEEVSSADLHERGKFVVNIVQTLFFKIKQGLYEFDPRIGHSPRDGPLPACPLLDPGEPLSRTGGFDAKLYETYPNLINEDRVVGTHCPLCGGEIGKDGHDFIWGGGNMLWVHTHCWRGA